MTVAHDEAVRSLGLLAERAPRSLAAHAALIHRDARGGRISPARHHQEWIRVLEDPIRWPWVVIVAPPGYAKSTWFSVIYPSWRIGASGGRVRIGLVSNTATLAEAFAAAVRDSVESPAYQLAYPDVRPDHRRGWLKTHFYVSGAPGPPNPTLAAIGIGGQVQGRRFDEIILDDPTSWKDARSEVVMEAQRHFVTSTLLTRLPPGARPPEGQGGRVVVVCTRWSATDLVPLFEQHGFRIVHMPALGYWDKRWNDARESYDYGSEPLWPEVESAEQLLQSRERSQVTFELVMQGNVAVLAGRYFNSDWFQWADDHPDPGVRRRGSRIRSEMDTVVQYVDTAGGKDQAKGDYFAIATIGWTADDDEVWVLDVYRDRIEAPEQERAVIREALEWDADVVAVEEKNEGIALLQNLRRRTRLPLVGRSPSTDKEWRAIPLANAYRARRVWHPSGERWVQETEAELEAFPRGRHDDVVDALAGAYAEGDQGGRAPRVAVLTPDG